MFVPEYVSRPKLITYTGFNKIKVTNSKSMEHG